MRNTTTRRAAGVRRGNLTSFLTIRLSKRDRATLDRIARARRVAASDVVRDALSPVLKSAPRVRSPRPKRGTPRDPSPGTKPSPRSGRKAKHGGAR